MWSKLFWPNYITSRHITSIGLSGDVNGLRDAASRPIDYIALHTELNAPFVVTRRRSSVDVESTLTSVVVARCYQKQADECRLLIWRLTMLDVPCTSSLSPEFGKFQMEVRNFWRYPNVFQNTVQDKSRETRTPKNQLDPRCCFDTIPACDGRTDRHTQTRRHATTAYTALA